MKTIVSVALVLSVVMLFGCAARTNMPSPQATQVSATYSFEGKWVISQFQERGTLSLKHDGVIVTVTKRGDIYNVEAPDWVFNECRFRLARPNLLIGESVQDEDGIREAGPAGMPESAISQAAASKSVVYRGTLTMLRDGKIVAERNNLRYLWSSNGRFVRTESVPNWIKFTLTRKET